MALPAGILQAMIPPQKLMDFAGIGNLLATNPERAAMVLASMDPPIGPAEFMQVAEAGGLAPRDTVRERLESIRNIHESIQKWWEGVPPLFSRETLPEAPSAASVQPAAPPTASRPDWTSYTPFSPNVPAAVAAGPPMNIVPPGASQPPAGPKL